MRCNGRLAAWCVQALAFCLAVAWAGVAMGQTPPADSSGGSLAVYQALAQFELNGGSAPAKNVVLKRDRAEITFDGTFYFEAPVEGRVRGAVFIGSGSVHADVPNSLAEKDNLQRMLHADVVDSTFKTAVLRFSDDTMEALGLKDASGGNAPDEAQKLATEFNGKMLKETGANIAARLAVSILDSENPGFFLAEFDKGSRGRFGLVVDDQGRVPASNFGLDGGEKGLFFAYDQELGSPDVWMAFYSMGDYQRQTVQYSDAHALVNISHYDMNVDLRDWKHMKLEARMTMTALTDGVRAIPLMMNEGLAASDDIRLKKALRLTGAHLADGKALTAVQEDWDGGVTLLLAAPLAKGQTIEPVLDFEGDFLIGDYAGLWDARYVRSDCWYPRHTDLNRSTFDTTFEHKKGTRVASIGQKVREEETPSHDMVTEWRIDRPVPITSFAVGNFQVFTDKASMADGRPLDLDFYRLPVSTNTVGQGANAGFILQEMNNCVRYFSALFGPYPYSRFGATFHPFPFGQGFATMLFLPNSSYADKYTFSFIAHETSHQWWGDMVLWRPYRDQWLSEGFANYSGVLYTERRDSGHNSGRDLLRMMHDDLLNPPQTLVGNGKGRLADVGPIILGHRLETRETLGAYETLIYDKGAYVLRMLDFLFSDPSTGDDKAFYDMMQDFVKRYANHEASTEDFMAVANEHFASTPLARQYGMKDLGWFFNEWVYQAVLPSYNFSYWIETEPDGSALIHGNVEQQNTPAHWGMLLPLVIHMSKDKVARGVVLAYGPPRATTIHVPAPPESVELDPDRWVLSDKTTTTKVAKPKS